jgi:O-antigen/teichoic acid export membrane protein
MKLRSWQPVDATTGKTVASGSRRAAVTLADQCLSSVSNFAVGVVVARLSGPAGLGVFSLAYASWLLLASIHRSLITDPMAIEGDARDPDNRLGIRRGAASELILGTIAAVGFALVGAILMAVGQHTFGLAMLAVAPWLIVLLLQDYWRWVGFMTAQPIKSLVNDILFDVVEAVAFSLVLVSHQRGPAVILAAWGAGALVGGLYGLVQFRLLGHLGAHRSLRDGLRTATRPIADGWALLRRHWGISRWIVANSLMNWGASQAYVFIAGFILGPAGLGGLKAAQTLVTGPSMVLIQAGGSVGLPEASKAYAERGWPGLFKVSRLVTAISVASVAAGTIVIAVAGRQLLSIVYGPQFAHLQTAAVLFGIAQTVSVAGLGCILVLKATRNTRSLLWTVAVALVVSVVGVTVLSSAYGVNGAAIAAIATSTVGVVGIRWFQHRAYRAAKADGLVPGPGPGPAPTPTAPAAAAPDAALDGLPAGAAAQ